LRFNVDAKQGTSGLSAGSYIRFADEDGDEGSEGDEDDKTRRTINRSVSHTTSSFKFQFNGRFGFQHDDGTLDRSGSASRPTMSWIGRIFELVLAYLGLYSFLVRSLLGHAISSFPWVNQIISHSNTLDCIIGSTSV